MSVFMRKLSLKIKLYQELAKILGAEPVSPNTR